MKVRKEFRVLRDKTPKYTVREVAEMLGLSSYTIRYYDNAGLIPGLNRTDGNARQFSDYAVTWLHLVHCLRTTGLPVEQVRHYIRLCQKGDSTIRERGEMFAHFALYLHYFFCGFYVIFAGFREGDGVRAAVEERQAELLLDALDRGGERRLRDEEPPRGFGEAPLFIYRIYVFYIFQHNVTPLTGLIEITI